MDEIVALAQDPKTWVSLLTLTLLEIVLGIDNIVFLSILSGKLPAEQQPRARRVGLVLALGMRIALLFGISWVMSLKRPLFTLPVFDRPLSGRDLILLGGGVFLVGKATKEIFDKMETNEEEELRRKPASFFWTVVQIVLLDVVFSLDSVITAVGMSSKLPIMITAVIISIGVMLIFAEGISKFVNDHPSIKVLALSFLILIGVLLVAESMGKHIDKGYIYSAMAFSLVVELINMRLRRRAIARRRGTE